MTPGMRLRRARRLNGIKSTQALSDLIYKDQDGHIHREKLARLERDDANPTIKEQILLCKQLNMSADWWIMSDAAPTKALQKKIELLDNQQRRILLAIMDIMTEKD